MPELLSPVGDFECLKAAVQNGAGVVTVCDDAGTFLPEEIANLEEMRLYRIAKDEGCLFTFGSDSHDDQAHKYYSNATLVANLLNLTENDLHPLVR